MTASRRFMVMMIAAALFGCGDEGGVGDGEDAGGAREGAAAKVPDAGGRDASTGALEDGGDAGADDAGPAGGEDSAEAGCRNGSGAIFLKVAMELSRRKSDLDERERLLVERERLLRVLEREAANAGQDMDQLKREAARVLAELRAARASTADDEDAAFGEESGVAPVDEVIRGGHLDHLAATIKGMRPASGAEILARMKNEADVVEILRRLNARQAAGLLGAMPAGRAATLAQRMIDDNPKAPTPEAGSEQEAR